MINSLAAGCSGRLAPADVGSHPEVPAAPASLAAAPGARRVTVWWTEAKGATSYNLYWSTSPGVTKGTGTKVPGVWTGSAVDGLASGTAYYFVVTAVSPAGESEPSQVVTAVPAPPPSGA